MQFGANAVGTRLSRHTGTSMSCAAVEPVPSMEATIICVGVLKTRAVSPTYP